MSPCTPCLTIARAAVRFFSLLSKCMIAWFIREGKYCGIFTLVVAAYWIGLIIWYYYYSHIIHHIISSAHIQIKYTSQNRDLTHTKRLAIFFFTFSSALTTSTSKQLLAFISMPGPSNSTVLSPSRIVLIGMALYDSILFLSSMMQKTRLARSGQYIAN